MNLKLETPSIPLLDNDQYEAAVSDIELELSLTKYQSHNDSDTRNGDESGSISESNNSVATAKSHISEKIFCAVKLYHLRVARNERRSKSFLPVLRYTIAFSLCTMPVIVFAFEMIPERCNICLDNVELNTYLVTSALSGGFGATLLSHDFAEYLLARFLGGTVGSLGALLTVYMMLIALPLINVLNVVSILVGILGAMPGLVVYFLVKIVSDECWVSDLQDFEDDFSSLTKLMIEEG